MENKKFSVSSFQNINGNRNHKLFSIKMWLLTPLILLSYSTLAGVLLEVARIATSTSGHDFNHQPIGQTFKSPASGLLTTGLYIADAVSFYPATTTISVPYLLVTAEIFLGETALGVPMCSRAANLTVPFSGYVEVECNLIADMSYSIVLVNSNGQVSGTVTGWVRRLNLLLGFYRLTSRRSGCSRSARLQCFN
jgi:hypothetical protein